MTVHNADIADTFNRLADLLEIEDANPFRVRAYRRAASTVGDLPKSVAAMVAAGEDLTGLAGVGEDLADKIKEIAETGGLDALKEVEARTPSTLAALTAIPGLGPKRVHALHERLGVCSFEQLESACVEGKVRTLPRFSPELEAKLLAEARQRTKAQPRFRLATVEALADGLLIWLEGAPGLRQAVIAGSFRRRKETVGDLDILATADDPDAVIRRFLAHGDVQTVVSKGPARSTVVLKTGLQVDLRMIAEESFGAALVYFTGSKAHNIAVRKLGQDQGLKVSEYGVFRGVARLAGRTEAEVYQALGLAWVEPELREDRGEVEAAAQDRLPTLLTLADIKGDLHAHTAAADGQNSLGEMVEAAHALGLSYLAIADPAGDAAALSAQLDEIDRLNETLDGFRVLKSSEVAILADGRLDLPSCLLKRLDVVVCAVRSEFALDREAQTERILRAMDDRSCQIIAHPTGRRLGERESYAVDLDRLIEAAKVRGCGLELNADPDRLGLDDVHCRSAKTLGVKVAIGTDARSTAGLKAMRFGVDQARRGWLEPDDVLNSRPWPELKKLLAR
jgi:DNA polymerase (family X)